MKSLILNTLTIALSINNTIFTYSQEVEIQNCDLINNFPSWQLEPLYPQESKTTACAFTVPIIFY